MIVSSASARLALNAASDDSSKEGSSLSNSSVRLG